MLIAAVLLATVLLRFALVCAVVYVLLPRGASCPRCHVPMAVVRNRVLDTVLPAIQRRWCLECGWNGVVRRSPAASSSLSPPPT